MNYYDNLEKKYKDSLSYHHIDVVILISIFILYCVLLFFKMYVLCLIPIMAFLLALYFAMYRSLNNKCNFFHISKNYNQYKIEQYELKKQVLLGILKQDGNVTPEKLEHILMHYKRQEPRSILSGSFKVNLLLGLFAFYSIFSDFLHFNNGVLDATYFQQQFSLFIYFMLFSFFTIYMIRDVYRTIAGHDSKKELIKKFVSILEDCVLEYDTVFMPTRSRRDTMIRNDKIIPQRKRNGNRRPSTK